MAAATQRIPVLVTAAEKKRIARKAREAGLSMGEYLRRAASAFSPAEEEQGLVRLIAEVEKSTAAAAAAIDDAVAYCEASDRRIAAMEAAAAARNR